MPISEDWKIYLSEFSEYFKTVSSMVVEHPEWRIGQTYFNVLLDFYPNIAEEVRGTEFDPFYQDGQIEKFLAFVCEKVIG